MDATLNPQSQYQFGIRTLLLLVFLVSLPLGWLALDMGKTRQRDAIERKWNDRGAEIGLAPDRRIIILNYRSESAAHITDDDLACLSEAPHLQHLDLRNTSITDEGLRHVGELAELIGLNLSATATTDNGLHQLAHMAHLRVIDLTETNVSNVGVDGLRKALPNCSISWNGEL